VKVFVTADTHFFHEKVINFSKRPFRNVEEMNRVMIDKWNKKASKNDIVIHLGDFAWASKEKIKFIRSQLNGTIFIVPGNHDWKRTLSKSGFIVLKEKVRMGNLLLTHKPIRTNGCVINLHGHLHQLKSAHGINACVDVTNFEPVPIEKYFKQAEEMLR